MEDNDKSGRIRAMIFTTSALLFLMLFGAGIALVSVRSSEFVKRGEISAAAASSVSIVGVLLGLFLAGFVAHCALGFVDIVARDAARRGSLPSDPAPPRPKKRSLRLVA